MKRVGEEIGAEKLQFYSARHSFATIAANDVRIPIYIANDMLCHVDILHKKVPYSHEQGIKLTINNLNTSYLS